MKTISEWARTFDVNNRPWLLLGKGPSFAHFKKELCDEYFVIGLNHVSKEVPVTLAHFIDLDAFIDCCEEVRSTARWVVMPWHPHEEFRPSRRTLADYARNIPALGEFEAEGRLLTYNLSTAKDLEPLAGVPEIDAKFFSAEAALNLLAECGVRVVRSLGVDGGTGYAPHFGGIASTTRLANGHATFDLQFAGIAGTLRRTGIQYAPLTIEAPARVFVGADPTQELAFRVLEFSIKKHASISVECERIDNSGLRVPVSLANRSRTGFSFARFKIPGLCGYSGRAIYLDADMQVFSDLIDLWARPFDGASMLYAEHDSSDGRIPQYSVLLLNCSELDWDAESIIGGLDDGRFSYESLMYDFGLVRGDRKRPGLPSEWNSLEHYVPGETKLLHYTDMPTQPWVNRTNQNSEVWLQDLRQALSEGCITPEFVLNEVERGNVSPELPGWVGLQPSAMLSHSLIDWIPPYRRLMNSPGDGRSSREAAGKAAGIWNRIVGRFRGVDDTRTSVNR